MKPTTATILLMLLTGCPTVFNGDIDSGGDTAADLTLGERCDEMQMCGRSSCAAEIQAARECSLDDLGCGADAEMYASLRVALAVCLDLNECVTVECDAQDWAADPDDTSTCDSSDEYDAMWLAWGSMFSEASIPACQAL